MDVATLFGLVFGAVCIAVSILIGGGGNPASLLTFVDAPSVFITFGGTLAAMAISHPLADFKTATKVFFKTFRNIKHNTLDIVEKISGYADLARRNGLLSLENAVDPNDDPFLRRGLRYAVDGMDRDQIHTTMQAEIDQISTRHAEGKKFFDNLTGFGPAFGMLGTLIGLVAMLKNMADPKTIGPNMAIALITSFYGAVIAFVFAGPIANKLSLRHAEETLNKEVILQGVLGIQAGENPRALKSRLLIYLSPKVRGETVET
ncbi:MAG: motility protein A [Planctomycetes bacterium]|nr:motility protein A [Planctomycetota bacterium]